MMNPISATMERSFTHEEISRRAREIWHTRGQPSGQDDEIWFEAERTLAQEAAGRRSAPSTKPSTTEPEKRSVPAPAAAEAAGTGAASKASAPKKRSGKGGR
jgi:hypothetical protein